MSSPTRIVAEPGQVDPAVVVPAEPAAAPPPVAIMPGEVNAAMVRFGGGSRPVRPSIEQIVELGKVLGVQAVIAGSVAQSEVLRSGSAGIPTVTLDAQMIEAESGGIIWAATHTERGSVVSARFLGNEGEPLSATTRRCVRTLVSTLLK